jgi:integrase
MCCAIIAKAQLELRMKLGAGNIVTISKRLGHAKPDITLRIYAHLFRKDDGKAAAAIYAALKTIPA